MPCELHKITDYRAYSTPLNLLSCRRILFLQGFLPNNAQYIVGDHCQLQHEFIAVKLTGWKSFNIHIRLDFTVVLFAFSMSVIEVDDLLIR